MTSMKARQYAPVAPLETEPLSSYTEPGQREEALRDPLRGIELGTYDQRMIDRVVKRFDNSTLRVFVSWMERVRRAGVISALQVDSARRANRGSFGQ
jgi:hypothetical protein